MSLEVVIRADGSPLIGSGHIMRCITLAGHLGSRGMNCRFVCRDFPENYASIITDAGFAVSLLPANSDFSPLNWLGESQQVDASQTVLAIGETHPDWIVVDHYLVDEEWEREVRDKLPQVQILAIDDLANRRHDCNCLMDLSPGRTPLDYKPLVDSETRLLTGLDYALLRPTFAEKRALLANPPKRPSNTAKILVTFGGGQTAEFLESTAAALAKLVQKRELEITVIGASKELAAEFPSSSRFITHSTRMDEEIASADIMICGAGGTNWERCCLGVPAVVMTIAENQEHNAAAISTSGSGIWVDNDAAQIRNAVIQLLDSPTEYEQMAAIAWAMCDGQGVKRLANNMLSMSAELLACKPEDARFVYDARYAGGAEKYYRNPKKPTYEEHIRWFEKALGSEVYKLFCVELAGEKVGHIRLDANPLAPKRTELGIALSENSRGQGLAVPILMAAAEYCRKIGLKTIDAEVHRENQASRRLFENAGFLNVGMKDDLLINYQLTFSAAEQ